MPTSLTAVLSTIAALMALVAVDAVVHISRHLLVVEVGRVIPAMTSRALENRIVVGVDVAGGAHIIGAAVIGGESRVLRVIEAGPSPG